MGAIDLVIQIESPTSVASGMQRMGRANHRVDAVSLADNFPEVPRRSCGVRGDHESDVRGRSGVGAFSPQSARRARATNRRNGRDEDSKLEELSALVRRSAPFAALSRAIFEGVLDMLSGPLSIGRVR